MDIPVRRLFDGLETPSDIPSRKTYSLTVPSGNNEATIPSDAAHDGVVWLHRHTQKSACETKSLLPLARGRRCPKGG